MSAPDRPHLWRPGPGGPPLLLLHATGGDETSLLPYHERLAPAAPVLAVRGTVVENGLNRYFRRFSEGVFDEVDLVERVGELVEFLAAAESHYGVAPGDWMAVGFSNGANIAAAVLLLRPDALAGAILLRAMVPLAEPPRIELNGQPVLIVSGGQDPIARPDNAVRLADLLRRAGAAVEHEILPAGHALSNLDVALARRWWNEVGSRTGAALVS